MATQDVAFTLPTEDSILQMKSFGRACKLFFLFLITSPSLKSSSPSLYLKFHTTSLPSTKSLNLSFNLFYPPKCLWRGYTKKTSWLLLFISTRSPPLNLLGCLLSTSTWFFLLHALQTTHWLFTFFIGCCSSSPSPTLFTFLSFLPCTYFSTSPSLHFNLFLFYFFRFHFPSVLVRGLPTHPSVLKNYEFALNSLELVIHTQLLLAKTKESEWIPQVSSRTSQTFLLQNPFLLFTEKKKKKILHRLCLRGLRRCGCLRTSKRLWVHTTVVGALILFTESELRLKYERSSIPLSTLLVLL